MSERANRIIEKVAKDTVLLGEIIAICVSWSQWQSVGWAVVHGVCGWGYILYFTLTR